MKLCKFNMIVTTNNDNTEFTYVRCLIRLKLKTNIYKSHYREMYSYVCITERNLTKTIIILIIMPTYIQMRYITMYEDIFI